MKPYWKFQGDFLLHGNLLLYQDRVTIPHKLQEQILQKLHQGHQGIQRCRLRAKSSMWWLNISRDINSFIQQCPECMKMLTPPTEPLITSPLPSHPWEKVASDLFHLNNSTYLIVVDYFSHNPEVVQLSSTTSSSVYFSCHGVPSTFVTESQKTVPNRTFLLHYIYCSNINSIKFSGYFDKITWSLMLKLLKLCSKYSGNTYT